MKKNDIFAKIAADIEAGEYGESGSAFITVRALCARYGTASVLGVELMSMLEERHFICRRGKRSYVTTGVVRKSSALGLGLRLRGSRTVGVMLNNIENPFFMAITRRLHDIAYLKGWNLIVSDSAKNPEREEQILYSFMELGVAGVISCPGLSEKIREIYRRYPLPCVLLGRTLDVGLDCVVVDNYRAGGHVASHFIESGCRRFAYVGLSGYQNKDPRLNGYRDMLASGGYELPDENVITVANESEIAQNITALLRSHSPASPLGIFCYHDLLAVAVLTLCRSRKIAVPDEISLVGFDNLSISTMVSPQLSTVSYQFDSIAQYAMELFFEAVKADSAQAKTVSVSPVLTIRESSYK